MLEASMREIRNQLNESSLTVKWHLHSDNVAKEVFVNEECEGDEDQQLQCGG